MKDKHFERKNSGWFCFWKKDERNTWLSNFIRMNEMKDQVCSSWFAPVGSAIDYHLLSKWVIYGEVMHTHFGLNTVKAIFCFNVSWI